MAPGPQPCECLVTRRVTQVKESQHGPEVGSFYPPVAQPYQGCPPVLVTNVTLPDLDPKALHPGQALWKTAAQRGTGVQD